VPANNQIKALVDRIERLEDEKDIIAQDIRDIYAEAKGNGFDTKALRAIIRLRKQDVNERAEQEALIDLYMSSLGMLAGTPLGQAAVASITKSDPPIRKPVYMMDAEELAKEQAAHAAAMIVHGIE
jgi:uncharacterized protein (UPF0335 family)